jgi:hypothetical protein
MSEKFDRQVSKRELLYRECKQLCNGGRFANDQDRATFDAKIEQIEEIDSARADASTTITTIDKRDNRRRVMKKLPITDKEIAIERMESLPARYFPAHGINAACPLGGSPRAVIRFLETATPMQVEKIQRELDQAEDEGIRADQRKLEQEQQDLERDQQRLGEELTPLEAIQTQMMHDDAAADAAYRNSTEGKLDRLIETNSRIADALEKNR